MEKGKIGKAAVLAGAVVLLLILWRRREERLEVTGPAVSGEEICVVIDPGHGGIDPGKVGVNRVEEKEINLAIALLVKRYLEANDVKVAMTRETDEGLYDADASNKKVQDMKRRLAMIEELAPEVVVSIHQNSYPEEYVRGAQMFYYENSLKGKELAEFLQAQFLRRVDESNTRQIKANSSYYLLKKTSVPIVIAECGFLSNRQEAEALGKEPYQERVAWAISMGILQYLNQNKKGNDVA